MSDQEHFGPSGQTWNKHSHNICAGCGNDRWLNHENMCEPCDAVYTAYWTGWDRAKETKQPPLNVADVVRKRISDCIATLKKKGRTEGRMGRELFLDGLGHALLLLDDTVRSLNAGRTVDLDTALNEVPPGEGVKNISNIITMGDGRIKVNTGSSGEFRCLTFQPAKGQHPVGATSTEDAKTQDLDEFSAVIAFRNLDSARLVQDMLNELVCEWARDESVKVADEQMKESTNEN